MKKDFRFYPQSIFASLNEEGKLSTEGLFDILSFPHGTIVNGVDLSGAAINNLKDIIKFNENRKILSIKDIISF